MAQAVEDALVVRMEASLRKFERQMERGLNVAKTSATGSDRAWDKAGKKIAANANYASTGLSRLTKVSGSGRFVLQNTANQIGDIAVQMQGGTSASRALGQQLPQLLGGFGALGGSLGLLGPLFGTVAALGIPMMAVLLDNATAAETLDDKIKALNETIGNLKSAEGLASLSPGELVTGFGDLADEAREIYEINREIAAIQAGEALNATARGIAGEMGIEDVFGYSPEDVRTLEESLRLLQEAKDELDRGAYRMSDTEFSEAQREVERINAKVSSLNAARDGLAGLAKMFGINKDQAREVAARMAEIGQADGPRQQAQAMSSLAGYINTVTGNLAKADKEGKALYQNLLDAVVKALELAKIDMASGFGAAADEAERLARATMAALYPTQGKVYSGRGGDPGEYSYVDEFRKQLQEQEDWTLPKRRKSGGGSRLSDAEREAASIYDQTRTAAEKYAAEIEKLDALLAKGLITQDTYNRGVELMSDRFGGLGNVADQAAGAIRSAFDGIFDDPARALENLGKQLLQMALYAQLAKSLPGVFGAGGIIPLVAGARASGGPVDAGRAYLVGERGPELVVPRNSGTVIPNHQLSGGGGMSVEINNYGQSEPRVERSKGPDGRDLMRIYVGEEIARGGFDGSMRSRYGANPQKVKR